MLLRMWVACTASAVIRFSLMHNTYPRIGCCWRSDYTNELGREVASSEKEGGRVSANAKHLEVPKRFQELFRLLSSDEYALYRPKMHCTSASLLRSAILSSGLRTTALPPCFLLPAFASSQTASFSSSPTAHARRDGNRARGVSALRHTGIGKKQKLSVKLENLPKPVLDPARRSNVQVDEDHGLWDFLPVSRAAIGTPEELSSHGRGWTVPELRQKDWDDLHRMWWVCIKERNRIATQEFERKRIAGRYDMYGDYEAAQRDAEVRKTMKAIRHCLTERWYAWENARVAGMEDEEVDLYADVEKGERAYLPRGDSEEVCV